MIDSKFETITEPYGSIFTVIPIYSYYVCKKLTRPQNGGQHARGDMRVHENFKGSDMSGPSMHSYSMSGNTYEGFEVFWIACWQMCHVVMGQHE